MGSVNGMGICEGESATETKMCEWGGKNVISVI
jgi:hypothetical protein